ncbi:MAG: S8 family serine peptidase [Bacteroidales bacterium]
MIKRKLIFAILFCFMGNLLLGQLNTQTNLPKYADNQLYVKYKNTLHTQIKSAPNRMVATSQLPQMQKKIKLFGIHPQALSMALFNDADLNTTLKMEFDSVAKMETLIHALEQDPNVEYVEKIPLYHLFSFTNDPYATNLGGRNLKWHLDVINASSAWEIQKGSPNIKVAIVDGAVWGEHEDLLIAPENQYNTFTRKVGYSGPPKVEIIDPDELCSNIKNCPIFNWSHGTHCAGLVGAINNNKTGIASIGSGVTLMGVSGEDLLGFMLSNVFDGVVWAAENGAKVISCSWGGGALSRTHNNILKTCYNKGIIVVFASGNSASSDLGYPAASPYVLSVGSVNSDKGPSSFSNYGSWVDVASPGGYEVDPQGKETESSIVSITYGKSQNYRLGGYSELNDLRYDGMAGTSMATPLVAGVCGLILSKDSNLNMSMMRGILMQSGQSLNYSHSSKNFNTESTVVDAKAALMYLNLPKCYPSNVRATVNKKDATIFWAAPTQRSEAPVHYKLYRNRELIDGYLVDTVFVDPQLEANDYVYEIQAVYADGSQSLKQGVGLSILAFYYNVKVEVQPDAQAGIIEHTGDLPRNEMVDIIAHPKQGYRFVAWKTLENTEISTEPILSILLKQDTNLIAEFKKEEVSISPIADKTAMYIVPNPALDQIQICASENTFDLISILNLMGTEVLNLQKVNTDKIAIDHLPKGLYFVKANKGSNRYVAKFIKK